MTVRPRGLLAALLLLVAAAPLSAQMRIGYVDTRKILQEMPARNTIEAQLRRRARGRFSSARRR
ncbi:MAG: OmpH family outer membrane protein [Gemmatimonadaceae bacterium]|nr:OmpH family outer membrane protein [Gemmatimonadaceae bacterium]